MNVVEFAHLLGPEGGGGGSFTKITLYFDLGPSVLWCVRVVNSRKGAKKMIVARVPQMGKKNRKYRRVKKRKVGLCGVTFGKSHKKPVCSIFLGGAKGHGMEKKTNGNWARGNISSH